MNEAALLDGQDIGVRKNARMVPLVWNVPTNVAAIVWMIPRVIKRLVFVIKDAVQGTLTVTAAQSVQPDILE